MRNFVNAICIAALTSIIAPAAMAQPNSVKAVPKAQLKSSRLASPQLSAPRTKSGKRKKTLVAPKVNSGSELGDAGKVAEPQKRPKKTAISRPRRMSQKKALQRNFVPRKHAKTKTSKASGNRTGQVHARKSPSGSPTKHSQLSLGKQRSRKSSKGKHHLRLARS